MKGEPRGGAMPAGKGFHMDIPELPVGFKKREEEENAAGKGGLKACVPHTNLSVCTGRARGAQFS